MQLAKIVQIFSAVRVFAGGHAYIGDLKSWFNQISIPEGIKALFSLALGSDDYEYNTLVMGGQPSAKLAHGISCIWIICSALDLGLTIDDIGACPSSGHPHLQRRGKLGGRYPMDRQLAHPCPHKRDPRPHREGDGLLLRRYTQLGHHDKGRLGAPPTTVLPV